MNGAGYWFILTKNQQRKFKVWGPSWPSPKWAGLLALRLWSILINQFPVRLKHTKRAYFLPAFPKKAYFPSCFSLSHPRHTVQLSWPQLYRLVHLPEGKHPEPGFPNEISTLSSAFTALARVTHVHFMKHFDTQLHLKWKEIQDMEIVIISISYQTLQWCLKYQVQKQLDPSRISVAL